MSHNRSEVKETKQQSVASGFYAAIKETKNASQPRAITKVRNVQSDETCDYKLSNFVLTITNRETKKVTTLDKLPLVKLNAHGDASMFQLLVVLNDWIIISSRDGFKSTTILLDKKTFEVKDTLSIDLHDFLGKISPNEAIVVPLHGCAGIVNIQNNKLVYTSLKPQLKNEHENRSLNALIIDSNNFITAQKIAMHHCREFKHAHPSCAGSFTNSLTVLYHWQRNEKQDFVFHKRERAPFSSEVEWDLTSEFTKLQGEHFLLEDYISYELNDSRPASHNVKKMQIINLQTLKPALGYDDLVGNIIKRGVTGSLLPTQQACDITLGDLKRVVMPNGLLVTYDKNGVIIVGGTDKLIFNKNFIPDIKTAEITSISILENGNAQIGTRSKIYEIEAHTAESLLAIFAQSLGKILSPSVCRIFLSYAFDFFGKELSSEEIATAVKESPVQAKAAPVKNDLDLNNYFEKKEIAVEAKAQAVLQRAQGMFSAPVMGSGAQAMELDENTLKAMRASQESFELEKALRLSAAEAKASSIRLFAAPKAPADKSTPPGGPALR